MGPRSLPIGNTHEQRPHRDILLRFRPHLATMEKVLGAFLVLTGILFITNAMTFISGWILQTFPGLATIG